MLTQLNVILNVVTDQAGVLELLSGESLGDMWEMAGGMSLRPSVRDLRARVIEADGEVDAIIASGFVTGVTVAHP